MKLRNLMIFTLPVLIFSLATSYAHQGATGVVKERMMLMKGIKKDMKRLKLYTRQPNPGAKEDLKTLLGSLKTRSREILPLFPRGSQQHPSEARSEIWQDWSEFEKLTLELETGFDRLGQSLQNEASASIKPYLKEISNTCSSCHDRFREEK